MAKMPDLFHEAEEAVFGHLHHHTARIIEIPQDELRNQRSMAAWAAASATMKAATAAAPQQEETMSLIKAAVGLKAAVGNMDGWFKEVVETHLPAVFAEAEKYENDPIVKALEGIVLPPEIVQQITGLIALGVKAYPELQSAAPADPQQPVQQGAPAQ